jgi:acetaldehyde dehydrogenase (acetylating)
MIMRDTVLALVHDPAGSLQDEIVASIEKIVADVAAYVPGYRLDAKRSASCEFCASMRRSRILLMMPNLGRHGWSG